MSVLSVEGLSIRLPQGADRRRAVDDASFALAAGEILCLVGESGSGKSMAANAIMGLLPDGVEVEAGRVLFEGRDLLSLPEAERRTLRGARIAMVFQEPASALNPVMRIGDQIAEVFAAHGRHHPRERWRRAVGLAAEVGLPEPERIMRAYPFQLSGGQRQRAMIAMALALAPRVLIADEPTTALDVTTQAQILDLIAALQRRHGMAVLFITHDFGIVARIAARVVVMREGAVVEAGPAERVLRAPRHPDTRRLLAAVPSDRVPIPAQPPRDAAPLLRVEGLRRTFATGSALTGRRVVRAVHDVSLTLARGEVLGLVGESGSGKSTLGRCIVRLVEPDRGRVLLAGEDLTALRGAALRRARRRVQMVFQDPYASLNPATRIARAIAMGPVALGTPRRQAMADARRLLETVGLSADAAERLPHEFSGGQRQRIAIARALAMRPELIIADEAVSALDVSIQAQILDLLRTLRAHFGLSLLFITHDLRVAAQLCDRIAVMRAGQIVEEGTVAEVFLHPRHPYTQCLLAAVPGAHWRAEAHAGPAAPTPSGPA